MSKYKAGDKVVLEMLSIDGDGFCKLGNEHYSWWERLNNLGQASKPLLAYTEPLEVKIRRQAAEITRLLAENAELKKDLEYYHTGTDTCDMESVRAAGQEEAWELARKIAYDGYRNNELKEIFGSVCLDDIFNLTDTEAAEKVAEWERKNKGICVGDEVELINGAKFVVTYSCGDIVNGVSGSGRCFEGVLVQGCKKTGRHIDVASMLAQIEGEQK